MECVICLEELKNPDFLPCLHSFHTECINKWINKNPYCPICKIPISVNTPELLNHYNKDKKTLDDMVIEKNILYHRINELQQNDLENNISENENELQQNDLENNI